MFKIGCHLSASKGYLEMAKMSEEIGANTFQFFTRNPRGGQAKVIDELLADKEERQKCFKKATADLNRLMLQSGLYEGLDFGEISGQETVKKAVETAAAGFHHILLIGAPGAGKTMIAKRTYTEELRWHIFLEMMQRHKISMMQSSKTDSVDADTNSQWCSMNRKTNMNRLKKKRNSIFLTIS